MTFLPSLKAISVLVAITAVLSASTVAASSEVAGDGSNSYMTNTARNLRQEGSSRKLQRAAQSHSYDMARWSFLGHTGSDGSTIENRIDDEGFYWYDVGENVAAGQASVRSVMESWMNSRHHRANILSRDYRMFGCGYAYNPRSGYDHFWTQDFASGNGEACN
ncbi:unnamed protein product [Phytophthora fragariaefolia]|uniref:Unnamed protein product n=1 Tax=Phytophthora fragariaefolia TaxID=1490495 RepID=A0A9W6XCL9_9STRA|nr:unnamed protein product [Phytophthora fragariaefolia]